MFHVEVLHCTAAGAQSPHGMMTSSRSLGQTLGTLKQSILDYTACTPLPLRRIIGTARYQRCTSYQPGRSPLVALARHSRCWRGPASSEHRRGYALLANCSLSLYISNISARALMSLNELCSGFLLPRQLTCCPTASLGMLRARRCSCCASRSTMFLDCELHL